MLLKFEQAEALFSAKHHDEACKTSGNAGPEPPAGLLPVEEHGKKHYEAGPEIVHHAHLHGLLGAVGKVERQAVADGVDIAHRHAEEEEFLRELPEVRQAEDKEEEGARHPVEHGQPGRHAEGFRDAAGQAYGHTPAQRGAEADEGGFGMQAVGGKQGRPRKKSGSGMGLFRSFVRERAARQERGQGFCTAYDFSVDNAA